jgi:hypothetical protein
LLSTSHLVTDLTAVALAVFGTMTNRGLFGASNTDAVFLGLAGDVTGFVIAVTSSCTVCRGSSGFCFAIGGDDFANLAGFAIAVRFTDGRATTATATRLTGFHLFDTDSLASGGSTFGAGVRTTERNADTLATVTIGAIGITDTTGLRRSRGRSRLAKASGSGFCMHIIVVVHVDTVYLQPAIIGNIGTTDTEQSTSRLGFVFVGNACTRGFRDCTVVGGGTIGVAFALLHGGTGTDDFMAAASKAAEDDQSGQSRQQHTHSIRQQCFHHTLSFATTSGSS